MNGRFARTAILAGMFAAVPPIAFAADRWPPATGDIAPLTKDADGICRGAARKDADTVNIAIDLKGNVVSQ